MRTLIILCLLLAGGVGYGQNCQTINTSFDYCEYTFFDDGSGFDQNYATNQTLCWLFTAGPGLLPTLGFEIVDTEAGFDYVRIYDGSDDTAPLLGEFSGPVTPGDIFVGTSGQLFLKFNSDEFVTGPGFQAFYDCIPGGNNCNGAIPLFCGETDFGSNVGTGNDWDESNYSCAEIPVNAGFTGNDVVYEISHPGGLFTANLFSDNNLDFDLFLFDNCGGGTANFTGEASFPDCLAASVLGAGPSGLNFDNIHFNNLESGTYYLVVDAQFASTLGSYRLTYNCGAFLSSDEELICGTTYNHENRRSSGYTNQVASYCNQTGNSPGSGCTGPERVYIFYPPTTGEYTFTLTPNTPEQDFEMFLVGNDGNDIGAGAFVSACLEDPPTLGTTNQPEIITETLAGPPFVGFGCHCVFLIVDGFDGDEGDYTLTVSCPSTCDDPTFTQCGNQDIIPLGNNSYRIDASDPNFDFDSDWVINATEAGWSADADGTQLFLDVDRFNRFEICYPYLDADGCTNYCCRDYCIETTLGVTEIDYSFTPGTGFNLTLSGAGNASQIEWYEESNGEADFIGGGFSVNYPLPGNCRSRTFFVHYFDNASDCYRTVRREILICDPYACGDIVYTYTDDGGYLLQLTGVSDAQDLSWQDDATGQGLGAGFSTFIPINVSCGFRDYSVRYRIGNVWRICCIRVYICDPFQCGLITATESDGEGYTLSFAGPSNGAYSWTDDDTGQTIPGSSSDVFLDWDGACRFRNISVRFYDPGLNRWRICCLRFWFCFEPCDDPVFDFTCGNQTYRQDEADPSEFTFSTTAFDANTSEWRIDNQPASALSYATVSGGVLNCDFPFPGSYDICYQTLDEDNCESYCCRRYCVDFNPPVLPTEFFVNSTQSGYSLVFTQSGASNVSWYNEAGQSGTGTLVQIPFPAEGCFYRTYTFRFREADGCWKTARRKVFVCNPFNCSDIVYDYDRTNTEWDLTFQGNANASTITWLDDDNDGATLEMGTSELSIAPRPEGQCGIRNISVRYFDGQGWRYCCFSFWDCNPYDCANFATQVVEENEALQLTFNGMNATQITWQDDASGQLLANTAGQTVVPLPWPGAGCQTRFISVRYFDTVLGVFRICCIEVEVCRPVPCDEPVYANCNDQDYYLQSDGGYRIETTNAAFIAEEEWVIDNEPASEAGFTVEEAGNTLTCYFPPGNYTICYPYQDALGCLQYCCQEYCIGDPPQAEPTAFELSGGAYTLSLTVDGATDAQWYYWEGSTEVSLPAGLELTLPFPEVCYTRTFYCRYYDVTGCWRVVSRRVEICDPTECGNIRYRFDPDLNAFELTLEEDGVSNISWYDDDGGAFIAEGQLSIDLELEENCGVRNISVRYFDGAVWRICCLRFDACNPFACNLIVPRYEEEGNRYVLTLAEAEGLEQFSWSDDDDPSVSFVAGGPVLGIPVVGACRRRNISVRYYDPVNGVWGVCCVSYWQCLPDECGVVIADEVVVDDEIMLSVDAAFTNVSWTISGADAGAGNVIETVIPVGQSRRVCVRYFDLALGYWRTCCRNVENPDCDLPVPTFSMSLPTLDSVRIVNTNITAGETYVWTVDGVSVSSAALQLTLHLPPGPHEICLLATNDCGSRTICRTIVLPDLANDLIFDVDEGVCGDPGSVIEVPLRVRNFRNVDAFQFTLSLVDGRVGKFLGIDYELSGGFLNHFVANDSTLALTWVQTGAASTTYPDSSILGNIRIELTATSPGDAAITYVEAPTESLYGLTDGTLGRPVLIDGTYGVCLADATLNGRVLRESGSGVARVEVELLRSGIVEQTMVTDLSGDYEFSGLTPGVAYTVRPTKDINHRNGVNSGDIYKVNQHIFGADLLNSPYQRIAANVINFSGIEATDISQLRQLIFQQITRFDAVSSWHFVPADYRFLDPENPLMPAYPRELTVTLASGMTAIHDFVAIKMGDIDESALPGQLTSSEGSVDKAANDLKFSAVGDAPRLGMAYRVDVITEDFTEMTAAQFSLGWEPDILRFDSVGGLNAALNLNANNFSFDATTEGQLPWLWFGQGSGTLADSTVIFSLYFTVAGGAGDTAKVGFTESPTEFYFSDTNGEVLSSFTPTAWEILLPVSNDRIPERLPLVISPNPADAFFRITGNADRPLELVRMYDARGRLVREWEEPLSGQRYSTERLSGGLYVLEIWSGGRRQAERLVVR